MVLPGAARGIPPAVEDTMFRALAVLRVVLLANTLGIYFYRWQGYAHPWVGVVVMGGLVFWTAVDSWGYGVAARRGPVLLVPDVVIAIFAILLTPWVKGSVVNATLPGFWVAAAVLACAIHWRWVGGLAAAALVALADWSVRSHFTQQNWGNTFLLLLGGVIVGFLVDLLQQMATARDQAERAAAAALERGRLARVVHDGVLQVLALVQKRGLELGGDFAALGRLAGEQEIALREFVQHDTLAPSDATGSLDLSAVLARQASPSVTVSTPGPLVVPAAFATEVGHVVAACLSNVRHHVGRDAPAWVLLEDRGSSLVVSVRDEGPGIPAGRLASAAAEGRLGVSESIQGRVAALGGSCSLETGSWGTEWEFELPLGGRP
jgi:signal transduction histidine kinase